MGLTTTLLERFQSNVLRKHTYVVLYSWVPVLWESGAHMQRFSENNLSPPRSSNMHEGGTHTRIPIAQGRNTQHEKRTTRCLPPPTLAHIAPPPQLLVLLKHERHRDERVLARRRKPRPLATPLHNPEHVAPRVLLDPFLINSYVVWVWDKRVRQSHDADHVPGFSRHVQAHGEDARDAADPLESRVDLGQGVVEGLRRFFRTEAAGEEGLGVREPPVDHL